MIIWLLKYGEPLMDKQPDKQKKSLIEEDSPPKN